MVSKHIIICVVSLLLVCGTRCQSDDSDILGTEEVHVEAKEETMKV